MTTSNRFITFTQSWLVKTSLIFFVSAFIFSSCGDDLNTIGFKPDKNRFKVSYREFELPSSVFLAGPVNTSNHGGDGSGSTPRILVGSYTDDKFGKISAEGYFQFRPNSANAAIEPNANLESLKLNLSFDYYHYGSANATNMNFYIHEVMDSLITEQNYYQNADVNYSPAVIGSGAYGITPSSFDDRALANADDITTNNVYDTLTIPLDQAYAEALFQLAKSKSNDYLNFRKFRRIFKGLVIRSENGNQVVGFNPSYAATGIPRSRMIMSYTYLDTAKASSTKGQIIKKKIEFVPFADANDFGTLSFSKITADRSGTPFQNVNETDLYRALFPDGDNRFVASGTPIYTKFDISGFFSFSDTISNMLINSAEIVIDPVETSSFNAPNSLFLRMLNKKDQFLITTDTLSGRYTGYVLSDTDGNLIVGQGVGSSGTATTLVFSQTDNVPAYKATLTNYFQNLYSFTDKSVRLSQYALVPSTPAKGKALNRLVFNKEKLKLRIYYTTPLTKKDN